jgi:hypothetical protein
LPPSISFITRSPTTRFASIANIIKEWNMRRSSPNSLQVQCMQSVGCDLVPAVSDYQPTGPDHLQPGLQGANRLIAAGVIEPVIGHDKVSVKLSLPQRSVHSGDGFSIIG